MTIASRKPPKPAQGPQLLIIPNRETVLAEFRRCAPIADLINIELERGMSSTSGPILNLCAFIRDPPLNLVHVIYSRDIKEHDIMVGTRSLAQLAERETIRRRCQQGEL